jgi:hypothetical protein
VRDGQTGVLVPTADVASFIAGIERLDERTWDRQAIRAHAERFDTAVFIRSWRELLSRLGVDPGLYSAG